MNRLLFTLLLTLGVFTSFCQTDSTIRVRPKVGIFVPLYLDDVFTANGTYKYPTSIPKNVLSGLDFYNGVRLAIDSLQIAGAGVDVFVLDSKDRSRTLQQAIDQDLHDVSLLIGMEQGSESLAELRTLAEAAHKRNIPFLSATYPNDGGVAGNPSLVILNSTLKTHTLSVYKYIQRNYSTANITVLSQSGTQEGKMKSIFKEANDNAVAGKLKWKMEDVSASISKEDLLPYMDSTRTNIFYCATLDLDFAQNLIRQLSSLSDNYISTVIGMPTWEGLRLDKQEYKSVEVIYTTPFVTSSGANPRLVSALANTFKARSGSRASDMVYRGYEVTLRYISNMLNHVDNVINLSDRIGIVFTDFDIQPVKSKPQNDEPDYYENAKIYFVKKLDGILQGVY